MAPGPARLPEEPDQASLENPRGTLVIVLLFGLVFAVGWLVMYFWVFLGRGALHS
jgi:hypothetical protein